MTEMGNIRIKIKKILNDNKALFNNVVGAFFIKGCAVFINILILPAYMSFFKDYVILGIWFTLVSILSWILSFDLGIGNGLRNNLVKALVEKNEVKAKKYVSSAYFIVGLIALCLMVVGYVIIGFVDWNNIFHIHTISLHTLVNVIRLMWLGIVFQFFLKLILSILNAMQKTAAPNLVPLISNIIILIYITIFNGVDIEQNLINLSLVNILSINVPLMIATVVVFSTTLKGSKPNLKYYVQEYAEDIVKLGGSFFGFKLRL